jgi:hypothetical protein
MSLLSFSRRWRRRCCGGAAGSRYVGDVDRAYDVGHPFATSVVRSNRMANKVPDKIPSGPKLDALIAEKVFGWKNVHKHDGALVGKKQDKAGHWRRAKVPSYSTNPLHAYSIEERMKQLGRLDRYQKELSRISRAKHIPSDWASPDQRCRAAIKAVGQYGQVVPLRKSGNR